jgi:hypothetical protein
MKKIASICISLAGMQLMTATMAGTFFSDESGLNRAMLASPRAREEFAGLSRAGIAPKTVDMIVAERVASPRFLEEFPEANRASVVRTTTVIDENAGVTGRGVAANPRAIEEIPALGRKEAPRFQVAPLK